MVYQLRNNDMALTSTYFENSVPSVQRHPSCFDSLILVFGSTHWRVVVSPMRLFGELFKVCLEISRFFFL
jgi:hypothetical protein